MSPRSIGVLRGVKPVPRSPTLVRSKSNIPKKERRWPTGNAARKPITDFWKHEDKKYLVPITVYNIPNNSPVYTKWPKLKEFRPALNPRAYGTVKSGGSRDARPEEVIQLMPYMYSDLGVMVFEGLDESQVKIVGDLLNRIVKHEGRLQYCTWADDRDKKVFYDKWSIYRLPVNPVTHIDDKLKPERGFLHPRGLDELTDLAVRKWRDEWQAKRESLGNGPKPGLRYIKDTKKLWLQRNMDGMGLINSILKNTINGPRVTSVDAYVATVVYHNRVLVDVELHTVGTKHFLGCASYKFGTTADSDEIDPDEPEAFLQKPKPKAKRLYVDEAPASIARRNDVPIAVMNKMWKLEKKVWEKIERTVRLEKNRERKAIQEARRLERIQSVDDIPVQLAEEKSREERPVRDNVANARWLEILRYLYS
ncbi:hypothetical protein FIE12Z_5770 [Fusarium flagelliforme]|uniref:Uncharacterized protein n=1 Tax=Fusarium flagelliforme TaxID=2675880 RepID=A0A395MPY1_9HYPO|nr:hypothetical protein FIE12Z_5770 [Fusarium flagelliforme]